MKDTQPDQEEAKRFTHWARRDQTFSLTSTTEKPPKSEGWTTTEQETRSCLPLEKKLKTKETSSCIMQGGMKTREATYQMRDKGRALMTMALPRKDKERLRQEDKTLSTVLIRGRQLSAIRSPMPMKMPRTFNFEEHQSRSTGESVWPRQLPSQRPLDFPRFSLKPEAFSY